MYVCVSAGTDAGVWIVLMGEDGATRQLPLDAKGNQFEKGSVDNFEILSVDLGKLSKVIIIFLFDDRFHCSLLLFRLDSYWT